MPAVRAIPGWRKGSRAYRGPDNYDYHKNRDLNGNRKQLRCALAKTSQFCPGTATVRKDGLFFKPSQPHNHDYDKYSEEVRIFRNELIEASRVNLSQSCKAIYTATRRAKSVPKDVSAQVPLRRVRSSMRRARLEQLPNLPKSLKQLEDILVDPVYKRITKTLDDTDNVFAGSCGSGSTRSLIFASRRMQKLLKSFKVVFSDGTFKPVPSGLRAAQVWNICTTREHCSVPLVRVLMRSRTTEAYVEVLVKLREMVPRFYPETIFCDFEKAQHRAWGLVFPKAQRHGCFFHYTKAIGKKAGKLGLRTRMKKSRRLRKLVRMLAALPLLPTEYILDGVLVVILHTRHWGKETEMLPLLSYWHRTWSPTLDHLSVSGCENRTTNICETDNRSLQKDVGETHPNVWRFIDGLLENEDNTNHAMGNLDRGVRPTAERRLNVLATDRLLQSLTRQIHKKEITVLRFLASVCRHTAAGLKAGLRKNRRRQRQIV